MQTFILNVISQSCLGLGYQHLACFHVMSVGTVVPNMIKFKMVTCEAVVHLT